jgi:hypothetical protein
LQFLESAQNLDEALFALSGKVNNNMADMGVTKMCVLVVEFLYVTVQVL